MIFPKACEQENRNIFLNFISANKMAGSIKKDKNPSTKYFLAILKKKYDLVELNALNENLSSDVRVDIQQLNTNFGSDFTEKTRKTLKNTLTF